MRKVEAIEAELARCNDRLKNNQPELRKARGQFGAALVKLVKADADFAAALLSLLRRGQTAMA